MPRVNNTYELDDELEYIDLPEDNNENENDDASGKENEACIDNELPVEHEEPAFVAPSASRTPVHAAEDSDIPTAELTIIYRDDAEVGRPTTDMRPYRLTLAILQRARYSSSLFVHPILQSPRCFGNGSDALTCRSLFRLLCRLSELLHRHFPNARSGRSRVLHDSQD